MSEEHQYIFPFHDAPQLYKDEAIDEELIKGFGDESKRLILFAKDILPIPNHIAITKFAFEKLEENIIALAQQAENLERKKEEDKLKHAEEEQQQKEEEIKSSRSNSESGTYSTELEATTPADSQAILNINENENSPDSVLIEPFLDVLTKEIIQSITDLTTKSGLLFGDPAKPLSITISEDKIPSKFPDSLTGIGLTEKAVKVLVENGEAPQKLYSILGAFNDKLSQTDRFNALIENFLQEELENEANNHVEEEQQDEKIEEGGNAANEEEQHQDESKITHNEEEDGYSESDKKGTSEKSETEKGSTADSDTEKGSSENTETTKEAQTLQKLPIQLKKKNLL